MHFQLQLLIYLSPITTVPLSKQSGASESKARITVKLIPQLESNYYHHNFFNKEFVAKSKFQNHYIYCCWQMIVIIPRLVAN